MKKKKILLAIGITITAILVIQMFRKKKSVKKRLTVVAEEGYETAEDILFPKRKYRTLP
jgi:hypothetical protein